MQPERVERAHPARRQPQQRRRLRQPERPLLQRTAEHWVDQHQGRAAVRVPLREVQRHMRTEAAADDDRRPRALGVKHRGKVVAPKVDAGAPARDLVAVAAQVDADQRVARRERCAFDEFVEAAGIDHPPCERRREDDAACMVRHRRGARRTREVGQRRQRHVDAQRA